MTKQIESLRAEAASKRTLAKLAEQNSEWHLASAYTQQAEDRELCAAFLQLSKMSKLESSFNLYVGDDGNVYTM